MNSLTQVLKKPISLLLILTALVGFFIYRDYGLTWDEPLFYAYGDALGYAYTPTNWVSGHFDLTQSYGPSATDHKNRGPAYLLLAREPVDLLKGLHIAEPDAWHLVNFLTFLLGVYFLYKLCERLMSPQAAIGAAAIFTLQPLLWGHAFINPKDMPFLVFLTGSVWLGFRMVDQLAESNSESRWKTLSHILLPAILLGLATSVRVLGPLAGLITVAYCLVRRPSRRSLVYLALYTLLAIFVMVASWPYLWEDPFRFLQVFQFMSDNPTGLQVLFMDQVYRAYDLPHRYLPFFLFFTLTEFTWPLFALGLWAAYRKAKKNIPMAVQALLILFWFLVPFAYAVLRTPPMYDGMRHFLFILPPIFVFAGFALEFLFQSIRRVWVNTVLMLVLLAPGIFGLLQLHPYEYAYYNSFIGGTGGAFRHDETDYWLTCYKEAVEKFNQVATGKATLYVHREAEVAAPYAAPNVTVLDQRGANNQIQAGDYILVNTRTNEDHQTFHDAPVILSVGRAGATFCVIKQVP